MSCAAPPPADGLRWWTPDGRLARALTTTLVVLVGALLVEVLFEGWVQTLVGGRHSDATGALVLDPPSWPKTLKNGMYLVLAALTAAKVAVDRRWRDFRTPADIALVVLGVVLLTAGLVNDSSPTLIGEALFVYLRGVVVWYAVRAARPSGRQIRVVAAVVAGIVALNIAVALVQMVVGRPAATALRWTELKWIDTNRAQALLTHPNHLGHLLSLTLLGTVAWLVTRPQPYRWVWLVVGMLALALSATQSRESVAAVSVAAGVIWLLARAGGRRVALVVLAVWTCTALQVVARPENRVEWQRRLTGVVDAFRVPSGSEPGHPTPHPGATPPTGSRSPAPSRDTALPGPSRSTAAPAGSRTSGGVTSATAPRTVTSATPGAARSATPSARPTTPARETRVLFYQQGLRLFTRRPLLGYGVGQFGGIVAEKHDPNWAHNPKFGPGGFDRHGFKSQQIDTFWLHLLVEAGAVGLLAYLGWLLLLLWPLWRRIRGMSGSAPGARGDLTALFGVGAVLFVVQVAFFAASLEDPMLPALLFAVLGVAWLGGPAREAAAG